MEIWKDIKGFEGLYQISNTGKVLSLRYRGSYHKKELTPKVNNHGYLWVELWNKGIKKNCLIHRLVAETFLENPNDYPLVNHKDENPLNCNVTNLEWCTQKYNCEYSIRKHPEKYMKVNNRKIRIKKPYKLINKIKQLDIDDNVINLFENIATIVNLYGYNSTSIKECCEHKRKSAYGYKWEYDI